MANFLLLPISLILIPALIEQAGLNASTLGTFYASMSIGLAIAGMSGARWPFGQATLSGLSLALIAAAATYLPVVHAAHVAIFVATGLASGYLLAVFEIGWTSMIQRRSDLGMIGRIYGLGSWTSFAARALGMLLVGAAVEWTGVPTLIVLLVATMITGVLAGHGYRWAYWLVSQSGYRTKGGRHRTE